jgi:hypothetical protein
MEQRTSLGIPGRVVRMCLDETGNVTIEEFLNVGEYHHGMEVSERGWYVLWRDVKNALTMTRHSFREE